MSNFKVLIADAMSTTAHKTFKKYGIEPVDNGRMDAEKLIEIADGFDGIAVRSSSSITAELLAKSSRLKVVGRAGIGVDNIDVSACTEHGVLVMNTPHGNSNAAAEHAVALMFSLSRHIPDATQTTKNGQWAKSQYKGMELRGKTLGLIGAGNIGKIVSSIASGIGMDVQVYDPFIDENQAVEMGVSLVTLDELIKTSDVISLHVPKTPKTENIINADALSKMKSSCILINCARGGLVDEIALYEALIDKRIRGAALDVFSAEPCRESPLYELPNVVVTPHLGASTFEAQEAVAYQIAEQMSNYLINGEPLNALNEPNNSQQELVDKRKHA